MPGNELKLRFRKKQKHGESFHEELVESQKSIQSLDNEETQMNQEQSTPPTSEATQGAPTPNATSTPAAPSSAPTAAAFVTGGFNKTLSSILPHFGTARQSPNNPQTNKPENMALGVTAPAAVVIPQNPGSLTPAPVLSLPIRAGYVRIKMLTSGTPTSLNVQGTDGTNTEWLYAGTITAGPTLSATVGMTITIPFLAEIACNKFTVNIAGVTGEADIEITGSNV